MGSNLWDSFSFRMCVPYCPAPYDFKRSVYSGWGRDRSQQQVNRSPMILVGKSQLRRLNKISDPRPMQPVRYRGGLFRRPKCRQSIFALSAGRVVRRQVGWFDQQWLRLPDND